MTSPTGYSIKYTSVSHGLSQEEGESRNAGPELIKAVRTGDLETTQVCLQGGRGNISRKDLDEAYSYLYHARDYARDPSRVSALVKMFFESPAAVQDVIIKNPERIEQVLMGAIKSKNKLLIATIFNKAASGISDATLRSLEEQGR